MTKQTIGQYRVGVSFNPSQNPLVDEIKRKAAELIDLIVKIEVSSAESHFNQTVLSHAVEGQRLRSLAMTRVEEAAMWAVKAATKPAPEPGD